MTIIYSRTKSKPANRKPGWKQAEAEYNAWLDKVSTMKSGIVVPKTIRATKPLAAPARVSTDAVDGLHPRPMSKYVQGSGTKPVHRPEIMYRDDPEMLARELKARERKFNVAPMYNKGGDSYITEEELQSVLSNNKRRP